MSNLNLFVPGYVNPNTAFTARNNGTRPYGFDEKKGIFTTEQAMKDFKPGLIMPEQKKSTGSKVVKALGVVGGLALAYLFRGKIKAGASKAIAYVKPYAEKLWAKAPTVVKNVAQKIVSTGKKALSALKPALAKVKPYVDKVLNMVKPAIDKAKGFVKPIIEKVTKLFA